MGIATSINEGRHHETLHLVLHVNTSQILLVMCHIVCLRVGTGIATQLLSRPQSPHNQCECTQVNLHHEWNVITIVNSCNSLSKRKID